MGIITVSRQLGSLDNKIIDALQKEFDYKVIDKNSLEEELKKNNAYNFDKNKLDKFDEKKPTFWDGLTADKLKYIHLLKNTIFNLVKSDNCIILGRGGHEILHGLHNVFHLRIISDLDKRIARVKEQFECNEKTAKKLIDNSDQARAGFHKYFFNCDWSSPESYDFIINTTNLTADDCIKIIESTVNILKNEENNQILNSNLDDLILGEKIYLKILFEDRQPIKMLDVKVDDGVVTLSGSVSTKGNIKYCTNAAKDFPGVKNVISEITHSVKDIKRLT